MKDLNQLKIVLSDLVSIHSMAGDGSNTVKYIQDLLKAPIADLAEYIEREGK